MKSSKVTLQELTPPEMQSFPVACPAVFSGDDGNYYIIGDTTDEKEVSLSGRVMKGETLVKISKDLLNKSLKR